MAKLSRLGKRSRQATVIVKAAKAVNTGMDPRKAMDEFANEFPELGGKKSARPLSSLELFSKNVQSYLNWANKPADPNANDNTHRMPTYQQPAEIAEKFFGSHLVSSVAAGPSKSAETIRAEQELQDAMADIASLIG